jgi:hypothetical protein
LVAKATYEIIYMGVYKHLMFGFIGTRIIYGIGVLLGLGVSYVIAEEIFYEINGD